MALHARTLPVVVGLLLVAGPASGEPYLAVEKGMHCSSCHSHQAGGGKRTVYGNVFAQTELAGRRIGDAEAELWTGNVTDWLAVGANLRGGYQYIDVPNAESFNGFDVTRGTIYVEGKLIENRLSVYIDQQLAPSSSINREAYVKLQDRSGKWQVTAGQFYLPYGLRLQDDSAFIRQVTGINFTNPDRGFQVGYENGPWSTIASVTNGSGGAAELDSGKQVSFVMSYVRQRWRAGMSFNDNNADGGARQMANVFFGLKTGPVVWLAEVDQIRDELPGAGDQDAVASLIEGNWLMRKGHNLKVSYEYFDPDNDVDEDHQSRWSLVWEHSPIQFVQARIGLRTYDGVPQVDVQNRDEFFLEIHGFF